MSGWTGWGIWGDIHVYPIHSNWDDIMFPFGMLFLLYILVAILNQKRAKPILSRADLAILTAMIFCSSAIGMWGGWWSFINGTLRINIGMFNTWMTDEMRTRLFKYWPTILSPQDIRAYDFTWGTYPVGVTPGPRVAIGSVPWNYWGGLATYLILTTLGFTFAGFFVTLFYRHLLIEVEKLEFGPIGGLQLWLVNHGSRSEEGKTLQFIRNKYFLAGVLVELFVGGMFMGVALQLIMIAVLGPGPAKQYIPYLGATFGINWPLDWDFTRLGLLPASVLAVTVPVGSIGWGYFIPLDILITFVVAWILFNFIISNAIVAAGLAPVYGKTYWTVITSYPIDYLLGGPSQTRFVWTFGTGLVIGFGLYALLRQRRTLEPLLMGLFKKPPEELSKEAPISYRLTWIGLIVSALVWLGTALWVGGPILPWIIIIITFLLVFAGMARFMAETGGGWGCPWGLQTADYASICAIIVNSVIVGFNLWGDPAAVLNLTCTTYWGPEMMISLMYAWIGLSAFYLARKCKVSSRTMLMVVVLTFIVTIVSQVFGAFLLMCFIPFGRVEAPQMYPGIPVWRQVLQLDWIPAKYLYFFNPTPAAIANITGIIIAGIVVTMLLYEVRRKWSRVLWWLNPIGIVLALWFGWAFFVSFTISLVLKYLLVRMGGAAAEEKGKHFATGLIATFFVLVFIKTTCAWFYTILGFNLGWAPWPTVY